MKAEVPAPAGPPARVSEWRADRVLLPVARAGVAPSAANVPPAGEGEPPAAAGARPGAARAVLDRRQGHPAAS